MKVKEILPEMRPREKILKQGVESLTEGELLAVILQKGTRKENVINLSNKLVMNGLNELNKLSIQELEKIKGIGFAKACQIKAVFEINKRYKLNIRNGKTISYAKDVYEYCRHKIENEDKEHFLVLHLDTKNKVMKEEVITIGILNCALIHPREVFKTAIRESANSIILVHNHPSGDPEPSEEDVKVTRTLKEAGELMSIKVLDHVIIGKNKYYSFAEKGFI